MTRPSVGAVGVYHETNRVTRGSFEAMYAKVPTLGLASETAAMPLERGHSAAQRIGQRDDDTRPVEGH